MWRPWTGASQSETESCGDPTGRGDSGFTDTDVSVLSVLGVDLCARAILDRVPVTDLVRSERVSRRWQHILHQYLRSCRSLLFYDLCNNTTCDITTFYQNNHRIIVAHSGCALQTARRTVEKWGHYIVQVATSNSDQEYLKTIALSCPYLRRLELCNINGVRSPRKQMNGWKQMTYKDIGTICDDTLHRTRNVDCVEIETNPVSTCVFGNFLKHIQSNNLTSLAITSCRHLGTAALLSANYSLRKVTTLELDDNDLTFLKKVHLLLNKMPQLEKISLSDYENAHNISNENLTESLCRLSNLKSLRMRNNNCVNDALVEALAQDCKQLEYLDISADNNREYADRYIRWRMLTACGLSVLCQCRPQPAVTTLCLGYIEECRLRDLVAHLPRVVQELVTMGCVEVRTQWLEETSRASFVRIHPLELPVTANKSKSNGEVRELHRDLKIVLSAKVLYYGTGLFPRSCFGRLRKSSCRCSSK